MASNAPHPSASLGAPPTSPPPPSDWLTSIDSVYTLFEDPSTASLYPSLSSKVRSAVLLCEKVIQEVGQQHCALSFNGGKDCTVLVHILAAVLRRLTKSNRIPSIPALYITCPSPFPTVERFISFCVAAYNLQVIGVEGGMKQGIREYLDGGGTQHGTGATGSKVKRDVRAIFVGTRRDDPHGPSLQPRSWTDQDWPRVERIHPILDWSYADVWQFLRCPALASTEQALAMDRSKLAEEWGTAGGGTEGVPYCLLYDQGYTSLGSTFNTLPNPELKVEQGGAEEGQVVGDGTARGRWRPAYMLKDGRLERAGRVESGAAPLKTDSTQ